MSRPTDGDKKKVTKGITMDPETAEGIQRVAKERDRSFSSMVNLILRKFLKDREQE